MFNLLHCIVRDEIEIIFAAAFCNIDIEGLTIYLFARASDN